MGQNIAEIFLKIGDDKKIIISRYHFTPRETSKEPEEKTPVLQRQAEVCSISSLLW